MTNTRRNRKRLAMACLAVWLFAFVLGVANGCSMLASAHAFEFSQSSVSHDFTDDGDDDVGCNKSCADGVPLDAKPMPVHGLAVLPVLIVQSWTDGGLLSVAARAEAANERRVLQPGAPPRLRYLRLTL